MTGKIQKYYFPNMTMSPKSIEMMNFAMSKILVKIAKESSRLCHLNKKTTVSSREIQTSVRLLFSRDVADDATKRGVEAVVKYSGDSERDPEGKTPPVFSSVGRVSRTLKKYAILENPDLKVGAGAPVYLAAVLDSIVLDILRSISDTKVTSKIIKMAILGNDDLHRLIKFS